MPLKTSYIKVLAGAIAILIIYVPCFLKAQTPLSNNLRVTFLKDTVLQNGSSHSFNVLRITNNSSIKQAFGLELNIPEGWNTLFINKMNTIEPGQTLELPIRVAAPGMALSNQLYAISVIISSSGINGKSAYTYIARVQPNAKWRAALLNPDVKLDRLSRETYFEFSIANTGNIKQEFTVNFNTSLELSIPKRNNRVTVAPGADTIIRAAVITDARQLEQFKPQDIGIEIIDPEKEQQLLVQKVYSNNTLFKENLSQWHTSPISMEVVSQNFNVPNQQVYFINSSGSLDLGNKRTVSFNFRSDDFYSENSGNSRYANVNYSNKHWNLSIGDQTEFSNILIDGFGSRIQYKTDNGRRFTALGVKSRLGNSRQFSFEQEHPLGKAAYLTNRTLGNLDIGNSVNSFSNISEFNKKIGESGDLTISGGLGWESIHLPAFNHKSSGQTAGLRYHFASPFFIARTINSISSRDFPGLERGVKRSSNEFRFVFKKYFAAAIAEYNYRSVNTLDSNQLIYLFGGKTSEYGFRTGFSKDRNNLTLTTSIVDQMQDSLTNIPFRSYKLNVNSGAALTKQINVSLTANILKSFSPAVDSIKSVYAVNAFGSIQSKSLGLNFRFDKGPSYYAELMTYSSSGFKGNRFQIAPFGERSFFKQRLTTRLEFNYARDISSGLKNYVARLDLNLDLNKNGLSMRFYGNHDFANTNAINSMNMSLRKNFTMPLVGLKKYSTLKVVLFKDNNNNNIFDLGDEPIPEANIRIGGQFFVTGKHGEAIYKNIKPGSYPIDLGQVTSIRGWIAKSGFNPTIEVKDNETVYVPFQKSKFLSGRLNLVKDPLSKMQFSPSNIRITAISSKGDAYSTLTNDNGAFFMNVPEDTYLVQINANVFNEQFRVLQETFNADLINKQEESITFEIRERKRTIIIRKPGS